MKIFKRVIVLLCIILMTSCSQEKQTFLTQNSSIKDKSASTVKEFQFNEKVFVADGEKNSKSANKDILSDEEAAQSSITELQDKEESLSDNQQAEDNLNWERKFIADDVIDMTGKSKNMIYILLFNILNCPDDYFGKTIKMKGIFDVSTDLDENMNPILGTEHYGCVVFDEMGCCAVGLEFTVKDDLKYPKDFPDIGSDIIITGVLKNRENEFNYVIPYIENGEIIVC